MSNLGLVVLDLSARSWGDLDAGERSAFTLLHEARRRWRRGKSSTSQALAAPEDKET